MLTFQNPEYTKEDLIIRLNKNKDDGDLIVQKNYLEDWKGCAIGCSVRIKENRIEILQERYGLPKWMGLLIQRTFNNLSNSDGIDFCLDVFSAIPVGVDLNPLRDGFVINILHALSCLLEHVKLHFSICGSQSYNIKLHGATNIIDKIIELYKTKERTTDHILSLYNEANDLFVSCNEDSEIAIKQIIYFVIHHSFGSYLDLYWDDDFFYGTYCKANHKVLADKLIYLIKNINKENDFNLNKTAV